MVGERNGSFLPPVGGSETVRPEASRSLREALSVGVTRRLLARIPRPFNDMLFTVISCFILMVVAICFVDHHSFFVSSICVSSRHGESIV